MISGISAILIVYNQPELLKRCLSSLTGWIDEIIIVDLESTEDIKIIAKEFGVVYKKIKKVDVVEKVRQKTLEFASCQYILFIDQDEIIPLSLAKELKRIATEGKYDYVSFPRQNFVFGKWVTASRWWPDYQVRFFKKGALTWPTILHAQPVLVGEEYRIPPETKFALLHHNYKNLDEWFEKNRRYAKSDAADHLESAVPFTLFQAMQLSVSEFVSRFFAGNGYRDGMHGLVLGVLQSFYYFLVYAYYWEGKNYKQLEMEESIRTFPRVWFGHALSETMHWDTLKSNIVKKIQAKLIRRIII